MTAFLGEKTVGVNLDKCSDDQLHELGQVVRGPNGNLYRYVKFLDAVTYVAGHVVTLASASTWNVTNDRSGGSSLGAHIPVGVVFQSTVPTQNQFGWVQITGIATVLIGSAAVVVGDVLVCDTATDGAAEEDDYTAVAHVDIRFVGVALATIADTATGAVLLTIGGAA